MNQLTPEEEFEAARNLEPDDCNIAAVGGARRVSWYGMRRCSSCGRHGGGHEADCLRREQRASDNGSSVSVQSAPPAQTVKRALEIAAHSPCRSKHGVVLFDPQGAFSGAGHNGPPNGTCPGRSICTGACSQLSVHAEVRALRAAQIERAAKAALGGRLEPLDLVHVELAANGDVGACEGPNCRSCAAQILDGGFVEGVWLYESVSCRCCAAGDRIIAPGIHLVGNGPGTLACNAKASWRCYSAEEFYRVTLEQWLLNERVPKQVMDGRGVAP